jgi:hypothetical protein
VSVAIERAASRGALLDDAPRPEPDDAHPHRGSRRLDLLTAGLYLLGSLWVMMHLVWSPRTRVQANNVNDDAFFQWALASGARVLTHGANPFVSGQMNVPAGVNLMANTSALGLTIPLAPVTLLFGASVSYAVLLVLALFGTALSWYYVLSQHLLRSRVAAVFGGLFCGFAPGMVAHANGHPNLVAQFLVPLIVWRALRLREPGRALRNGAVFGLLVAWQAFINEEVLFVTALGAAAFLLVYKITGRRSSIAAPGGQDLKTALRGLLVSAVVALIVLGYPLAVQFFGPWTYHGLGTAVRHFGADLTSFTSFSSQSLGGERFSRGHFAQNAAEENSFFGWPLIILITVMVWWLRRYAAVRALTVVALGYAVLSLGPRMYLAGRHTHIPGPFELVNWLPLFDSMVPTRLALAMVPVLGILLAFGYQEMSAAIAGQQRVPARLLWYTLLAAALVPLVPRPLPAVSGLRTPEFITSGAWRRYVPADSSLVTVPLAGSGYVQPLRWSAATGLDLPIARGYFLGPGPPYVPGVTPLRSDRNIVRNATPGQAIFGAPKRRTSILLDTVQNTGKVPQVRAADRAAARADLRYWRASAVVLQPGSRNAAALWEATTELVGFSPVLTGGVWLWDVRSRMS